MFRDYLLQHLPVKELAVSFRDGFGRPSKDLSVALGALVLQQLHDLTDRQTTEAVALNIGWHYALDIRHEPDAYLVQIMETFAEDDAPGKRDSEVPKPDLISHVAVDKLTMHDKDALEPALNDTDQRGLKPQELLADSHYGSNECLAKGREHGVEIVSPSMPAKGKRQGKLTLEDFELDDEGRVLRCPTGQVPVETSVADVRIQALFDSVVCAGCTRKGDCPAAAVGRNSRRWQHNHDRVRQRKRRLNDASEEFRDRYRWRAGIEATMSRFEHQMGMARLRVRRMAKVTYTAMLRALGLNIRRVAAYQRATA